MEATKTMRTNEITGYRVERNDGRFIHNFSGSNFLSSNEPQPIARGDAYRRLAAFLDANPTVEDDFTIVPVYREMTPVESGARELGGLLTSLCQRHGITLGLSQDQVETRIARELQELGASSVSAFLGR